MVRFIIIILIMGCFFCCRHSKLVIERGKYEWVKLPLRIDGLYYEKGGISFDGRDLAMIFFFYRNGVLFGGAGIDFSELRTNSHKAVSKYDSLERNSVLGWGIYNIKGDSILEFEKWTPSTGGGARTIIYTAKILNDSSFVVKKMYSHYTKKSYDQQDTFRFHQFFPKPDSTNNFIK